MAKSKTSNNIDIDQKSVGEAYLETLNMLVKGNLDQASIEAKNTKFGDNIVPPIPFEHGSISSNYAENHETEFLNPELEPISEESKISQEYYTKHADQVEEIVEITSKTEVQKEATDHSTAGNNLGAEVETELQIPYDVLVKMHFLEKRSARCCNGIISLYNDEFGCFEEQSETSLHVAIRKSLTPEMDMKLTKQRIVDVVHRIVSSPELQVTYEDFDRHTHLINFRNGVYNLRNGTFSPHSPEYLFTSYIDAEYEEKTSRVRVYRADQSGSFAKSDGYYFKKFLEDCTEGDPLKIKSLQQLTGYIISNEWRAKKFFVLIGPPHTGKSVWLALWRSLIGPKHTTAMSLKQLSETRFMTAELFRSKLNITAEMDENGTIKGTDVIKMITGGDLITAEKKGKDPFQYLCKSKLVACGNYMPPLNKLDGTSAFTDRILFLMFKNTIPEERRDKSLMDKLIAEKKYIVQWALEGLRELMDNNLIFTESEDARVFKRQYINELNNVPEFVSDRCVVDLNNHDYKIHRKQLYPAYVQFCRDNGLKALSKEEFYIEIMKLNVKPDKFRINGSSPLRGFRGIKLNPKVEEAQKKYIKI
ncbi:DNA primase family protein [Brevibacillus agri]|uniref:DNA primase family protein n=1 Tax=Brevibacillus agri TaxID=51101 RepID=UPI0018CD79FB|nr:phage/plasmid primase, P4 family [Brevibacillus agri]